MSAERRDERLKLWACLSASHKRVRSFCLARIAAYLFEELEHSLIRPCHTKTNPNLSAITI
jgi:hypothetical protein